MSMLILAEILQHSYHHFRMMIAPSPYIAVTPSPPSPLNEIFHMSVECAEIFVWPIEIGGIVIVATWRAVARHPVRHQGEVEIMPVYAAIFQTIFLKNHISPFISHRFIS